MRLIHTIVDHYRKPRVLGLDLLRITASLSIIGFHGNSSVFLGKNLAFQVLGHNGYLAVDIFFVLSGWLLTRQVLLLLLVGVAAVLLLVTLEMPAEIVFLTAGIFLGAALRDLGMAQRSVRLWKLQCELFDWRKIEALTKELNS